MTDDSATLRAMAEKALELCDEAEKYFINPFNVSTRLHKHMRVLANALLASQSSWAKEKEELERQRDEAEAALAMMRYEYFAAPWPGLEAQKLAARHASRSPTAKE